MTTIILCGYSQENKKNDYVKLLAVGDVNCAHWITPILDASGTSYPYKNIKHLLSTGDLVIANLEAPFCEKGEPYPKNFVFKVPARHADVLKDGNINLVSLANNHILDYGIPGLVTTIETLKKASIFFAGAGENINDAYKPAFFRLKNMDIAFFSFSMTFPKSFWATDSTGGTAYPYFSIIKDSISAYRSRADFIIASFHWGKELTSIPKDYQRRMAHFVINSGADLIIGHHPHVLQGIEIYKEKYIFYSLGNFVFASYSNKAIDSMILEADLTKAGIKNIRIIPINVNNYEVHFRPIEMNGKNRARVINHLNETSLGLNNQRTILNSEGFLIISHKESQKSIDSIQESAN